MRRIGYRRINDLTVFWIPGIMLYRRVGEVRELRLFGVKVFADWQSRRAA